jgi:hypothetical protein
MLEQALDELLKKLVRAPVWRPRGAALASAPTCLEAKKMLEDLGKWFLLQSENQEACCSCSCSPGDKRNFGVGTL